MTINNYMDDATRDPKEAGPGWVLLVIAAIVGMLVSYHEVVRWLEVG